MDRRTNRLLADWLGTQTSDNTRAAYRRDFVAFAAWCEKAGTEPLDVTAGDVNRYRDDCLAAGASSATVTRRLSGVASFFRHAAEMGALDVNPADQVDRPAPVAAERETLDDDEVSSLLDAAESMGPKAAALVALLALDGMKLGEVLAMDVGAVRVGHGAVAVEVARQGVPAELTLSERSALAVAAYLANRRRGPLFLGESAVAHRSSRLTRFGADFLIKRAASAASIDKAVSAGVLRRSYIDAAQRAGTPLEEIAHQVGHREVRETARLLEGTA